MLAMLNSSKLHFRSRLRCRFAAPIFLAVSVWNIVVIATGILVCLIMPLTIVSADERLAYDPANRDDKIRSLINQLDDRRFITREAASIELANIGAPALRALAMTVFEASPETAWRTKKAIELIGTHGDEDVFLKSLGILQLLYLDGSGSLDEKFLELQTQWKLEQKKIIISKIQQLGATVIEPQQNNNRRIAGFPRQRIANNMMVEVMPQNFNQTENRPYTTASQRRRNGLRQAELNINETTKKIDSILLATLEENRELVLGKTASQQDPVTLNPDSSDDEIIKFRLEQAVLRQQARQSFSNLPNGIVVSFDEKWQGTAQDIRGLSDLHGLSKIELLGFHPGKEQLEELRQVGSVDTINIEGDQISDGELALLSALPNLNRLEFAKRTITTELLSDFAAAKNLNRITFVDCELPGSSLHKLPKYASLQSLYLKEMQIDGEIFRALAKLKNVSVVNLSICKFKTTDYQELLQARPDLRVSYTPQAFLGVRGAMGSQRACQISEVVSGSGAEKGGIEIGDEILEVNGQPIKQFEDLRLHIAQHKVGEKLEIQVRREQELINLTVVLGSAKSNLER